MYQLEVKAALVASAFPPADGWEVSVDVDSMERCRGGSHPEGKAERAHAAEQRLVQLGARIGPHPDFGRVDVVATHPIHGTVFVEVEGNSSRQREQAMYSALGQAVLMMGGTEPTSRFALAVPDDPSWERQLAKIPPSIAERLSLSLLLVSEAGVRTFGSPPRDV